MRFVLFLLGIVLGVGGTLAYSILANPAEPVTASAPLPANAPITVTLGEPFLTAVLRRSVLSPAPVGTTALSVPPSALRAELTDDAIVVHATVDVLGKPTEGTAILRPVLRGGRLAIEVVETNLGDLAIPALEGVLDQQINARLASLLADMPVTFTGVKVTREAGLIVTCQVDLAHLERVATQGTATR
jgi:hypothetical protein